MFYYKRRETYQNLKWKEKKNKNKNKKQDMAKDVKHSQIADQQATISLLIVGVWNLSVFIINKNKKEKHAKKKLKHQDCKYALVIYSSNLIHSQILCAFS